MIAFETLKDEEIGAVALKAANVANPQKSTFDRIMNALMLLVRFWRQKAVILRFMAPPKNKVFLHNNFSKSHLDQML